MERGDTKIAKSLFFNRNKKKVTGFINICRLHLRLNSERSIKSGQNSINICKRTSSSKTFLFCVFWLIYVLWSLSTSTLICLSDFSCFRPFQATYQYSQLSRYIIKFSFIHSLALLQHSVVFQSLLVSFTHLLICLPILWKYLLNTLALFYFGFFILNYS